MTTVPPIPYPLRAGRLAEDAACAYLRALGLHIVDRNVRVPGGEIDIIAKEGATLVFVEVRWRAGASHGGALASIGWRKRARITRAAAHYLQRRGEQPPCRIDALCGTGALPGTWVWVRGL